MKIVESYDVIENDITYIVNRYDNGVVEKYPKSDPNHKPPTPEPQPKPVTNEELKSLLLDNMQGLAELYTMQLGGK